MSTKLRTSRSGVTILSLCANVASSTSPSRLMPVSFALQPDSWGVFCCFLSISGSLVCGFLVHVALRSRRASKCWVNRRVLLQRGEASHGQTLQSLFLELACDVCLALFTQQILDARVIDQRQLQRIDTVASQFLWRYLLVAREANNSSGGRGARRDSVSQIS